MGVMSKSGHANVSVRVGSEQLLLTKGVVRAATVHDLAVVGFDGSVIDGEVDPPSKEIVPMHAAPYRRDQSIRAIVHTHAACLGAFAIAQRELPVRYEPMLRVRQVVPVPVVPWAPRGSPESVIGIVDALKQNPETKALLLGNHGVLVFGSSIEDAVLRLVSLEEAAERELLATALGGAGSLPAGAMEAVRKRMTASGADRFIGI